MLFTYLVCVCDWCGCLPAAPMTYPVFVRVFPAGRNSVKVKFRGVSTGTFEEPLLGYKVDRA